MAPDTHRRSALTRAAAAIVFGGQFAMLGWLAGHTLTYQIVDPAESTAAERHMHAYLPAVGSIGMVLLALAVGLETVLLIREWPPLRDWMRARSSRALRRQLCTAAVVPAVAYVGGEILERVIPGVPWFPGWPLLLVGIPVQMLIGAALLLVARLAACGLSRLVRLLRRRAAPSSVHVRPMSEHRTRPRSRAVRGPRSRGPPGFRSFVIM